MFKKSEVPPKRSTEEREIMLKNLLGFDGTPFLDLEDLLDTRPFGGIHEEICEGLLRSTQCSSGTGGIYDSRDAESRRFTYPSEYAGLLDRLSDRQRRFFESLATTGGLSDIPLAKGLPWLVLNKEQQTFLKFALGVYFSWQNNLIIKIPDSWSQWEEKHTKPGTIHPETARLFAKTIDYIHRVMPFETVGRITLFGLDPLAVVPTHRDYDRYNPGNRYAEFINFCPAPYKKPFYVYDNADGSKHFPRSKAYWFNELDYHGVDGMPHFTYSLRVDGVFTEAFRDKIRGKYPGFSFTPGKSSRVA